jgi:plasmid stabilization system protein ParE
VRHKTAYGIAHYAASDISGTRRLAKLIEGHLHAASRAEHQQPTEYIAEHTSEERADGYVGRIVDFCNGLSTFPLRGTQRDDLLSGLRVTGFERRVTIAFSF